ncbi:TolC family protein [Bdellovibrio bacteriovorus]
MKFLTLIFTALLTASSAFAAPKTVVVNPTTLRTHYLSRNVGLAIALNDVQQAKVQVIQARANLLPSVNLGGVISSGAGFMLNSVSMLLPFLMPSNWMDLKESSHLLNAQGTSYYLAQLNGYASAYAIYQTIVGDMQLRAALFKQYQNFKAIEEQLRLPAESGIIPKEDYLQAQAQAQMALVQVSQIDELLKKEKASVRQMLGLELDQEIVFEPSRVASSSAESQTPVALLEKIHESSPETQQIKSLITAAQYNKFSKGFSFLNGASLNSNRTGGSFSSIAGSGSVNLGFGYFPALELSNLHIEQMRLRKKELRLDQANLIETTLGSFEEAQKQLQAAIIAENNLRKVYDAEFMRYQNGITDILHVLQAGNSLTNSIVAKVKAETAVDTLRVSMHRMMISDQFAKIENCKIERQSGGGIKGKLGRIFKPEKYKVSLDQVCGN